MIESREIDCVEMGRGLEGERWEREGKGMYERSRCRISANKLSMTNLFGMCFKHMLMKYNCYPKKKKAKT